MTGALEKLEESGDAEVVSGRHAAFFLALAEEAEPELRGPDQRAWLGRLETEHDNLRAALSWAIEQGEGEQGLRFGAALWQFWHNRGYVSEGIRWLERALAGSDPAPALVRVMALEGLGWLAQHQVDRKRAEAAYEEMLTLSRKLDDKGNVATALNSLGMEAVSQGNYERARELLKKNLAVLRELEQERNAGTTLKRFHVLYLLGVLAIYQEGDHGRATELSEEALAHYRDHQDKDGIPETLVNLGLARRGRGEHERAKASFKEAVAITQETGDKQHVINALEGMAGLAGALGEDARAARLWGAAEASREVIGMVLPPGDRALHEPYLAAAQSRRGDGAWKAALAEGRAMTLEEAVEYALLREEHSAAPTSSSTSERSSADEPLALTRREQEVAALVVRGLTNRQVAKELSISLHTVETHVARILKKLKVRSREQVVVSAVSMAQRQRSHPS